MPMKSNLRRASRLRISARKNNVSIKESTCCGDMFLVAAQNFGGLNQIGSRSAGVKLVLLEGRILLKWRNIMHRLAGFSDLPAATP